MDVLLLHDGELIDVAELLRGSGIDFVEAPPGSVPEPDPRCALLVTNARLALSVDADTAFPAARCVSVVEKGSRTLRTLLRSWGVDYVVERPFHPAALRGLVLHCLYRGPERRAVPRATIGLPVTYRTSLLRRSGILTDLSTEGCGLLTVHPARVGQRLEILVPATPETAELRLPGCVLRSRPADADGSGAHAIAVGFEALEDGVREALTAIVARFQHGPAVLPKTGAPAAQDAAPPSDAERPLLEIDDRRTASRRAYERRVPTLAGEAARVLLGRDLSPSGMRIDRQADLLVGAELRLALHGRPGEVPLVLDARVVRDDGEAGLVLDFHDVPEIAAARLAALVADLPLAERRGQELAGIVVSERVDA